MVIEMNILLGKRYLYVFFFKAAFDYHVDFIHNSKFFFIILNPVADKEIQGGVSEFGKVYAPFRIVENLLVFPENFIGGIFTATSSSGLLPPKSSS